jgi:serine protease
MRAIKSCADAGAKVISMSLGGKSGTAAYEALLEDMYDKNILIVAAAGNSGSDETIYPAYYKTVMSVASVSSTKMRSMFSTTSDQTEISAPGR